MGPRDPGSPPPLASGVLVSSDADGTLTARVELRGSLCATTAAQLLVELERLVEDGVVRLCVDLRDVDLVTSDALDQFDDIHRRLAARSGSLELQGADGVVRRALDIVTRRDPTFGPRVLG